MYYGISNFVITHNFIKYGKVKYKKDLVSFSI